MAGRVSQKPLEVAYKPTPNVRVSQAPVEAAYKPSDRRIRASQVVIEVLYREAAPAVSAQVIWID